MPREDAGADEFARQEKVLRIGKFGAQFDRPGLLVDRIGEEVDKARHRIFRPVAERQAHFDAVVGVEIDFTRRNGAADADHFARGLGEADIDGRDLLDPRHQRALGLADQRPFGHLRTAHPARDRRAHGGIAELQRRCLQLGADLGDIGLRLARCGKRGIVFLAADRVFLDQRAIAFDHGAGIGGGRLRALQCGLGLGIAGAQFARIDPEQRLPGANVGAFFVKPLLDDPGHPRTDFGHAHRFDPARQFDHIGDRLARDGDRADRDRLRRRRRLGTGTRAKQEGCGQASGKEGLHDKRSFAERQNRDRPD